MPKGKLNKRYTAAFNKLVVETTELAVIYNKNRGRYIYRRIKVKTQNRNIILNHKTIQCL